MPFSFSCPHCESHTIVDDEYAGQSGPCHACGRLITVPYPAAAAARSSSGGTATTTPPAGNSAPPVLARGAGMLLAVLMTAALLSCAGAAVYWLGPSLGSSQASQDAQCAANLRAIYQALEAYHADHGVYPPAYIPDKDGKPMHSWRVLLLPYLGHDSLYKQYQQNLPWNDPQNAWLVAQMPLEYACPIDENSLLASETSYFVLIGKPTAFPGGGAISRDKITDRPAETILIIEAPGSGVSWMEPRDFDVQKLANELSVGVNPHAGGYHVLTADGQVHTLSDNTPIEHLQALSTIRGNERLPADTLGD